jgi:hypothetical protein
MDSFDARGKNRLGYMERDRGHNLVPEPPAMMAEMSCICVLSCFFLVYFFSRGRHVLSSIFFFLSA